MEGVLYKWTNYLSGECGPRPLSALPDGGAGRAPGVRAGRGSVRPGARVCALRAGRNVPSLLALPQDRGFPRPCRGEAGSHARTETGHPGSPEKRAALPSASAGGREVQEPTLRGPPRSCSFTGKEPALRGAVANAEVKGPVSEPERTLSLCPLQSPARSPGARVPGQQLQRSQGDVAVWVLCFFLFPDSEITNANISDGGSRGFAPLSRMV